jgi:hypothetical protein
MLKLRTPIEDFCSLRVDCIRVQSIAHSMGSKFFIDLDQGSRWSPLALCYYPFQGLQNISLSGHGRRPRLPTFHCQVLDQSPMMTNGAQ